MEVNASSPIFDLFWVQHSIPCLTDKEHCTLNVGGVDLGLHCSEHHKNPAKFDTKKISQIVTDHIILGNFDVFCVQGISTAVLTTVLGIVKEADKAWESTNCANPYHDAPSMSHVIFYKTTVMAFVTKAISVLKEDKFYERIVKEYPKFFGEGLVDELPVDSSGFVGIYKLVAIDRYVKILSLALPPLTKEKPPRHKHEELFRNISLKKAIYTLFCSSDWISPTDINRKSIYFVYGSIEATTGMDLLNSSVHRIFTGGKVIMMLPQDDFDNFEHPKSTMVLMGNMQYFDPERVVPLRKQGLSSFIYFKEADILAVYKYQTIEAASAKRGIYEYPCGGRFLLFPIPDESGAAELKQSTAEAIKESPAEATEESTAGAREVSIADATKESTASAREESTAEKTDGKPIETEKPAEATEKSTVEKQGKTGAEATEKSTVEKQGKTGAEAKQSTASDSKQSVAVEPKQSTDEAIRELTEQSIADATEKSTEQSRAEATEKSTEQSIAEATEKSTEQSIAEATEKSTEQIAEATEKSTEQIAEATEKSTEQSTAGATEE